MSNSDGIQRDFAEVEPRIAQLLADISTITGRAEAAAVAAEQASSKANSESGFAYNAKQNAEDHARVIAQAKGTVEADLKYFVATKANVDDATQAIARAKASSDDDAQALTKAMSAAQQDANATAVARGIAEKSVAASEQVQADVAVLFTRVTNDANSVTQARATVDTSTTAVQALQAQVTEKAAKVDTDASVIAARELESRSALQTITDVATTANQNYERVKEHENDLEQLKKAFEELRQKTEALLPGATSAGLASAFREQKSRFDGPQRNWLITFIATVIFLLVAGLVGLPGLTNVAGESPSWDSILRHIVNRLPLVGPLVWLGIYSGRNYMLALRIQDDYAFKEVISATFEGYKREMANIPSANATAVSPLLKLCENVLSTLSERPGRIYEGHHEDITPLAPVTKAVAEIAVKITDKIGDVAVKAVEKIKEG